MSRTKLNSLRGAPKTQTEKPFASTRKSFAVPALLNRDGSRFSPDLNQAVRVHVGHLTAEVYKLTALDQLGLYNRRSGERR
jgi:hypothetical protein